MIRNLTPHDITIFFGDEKVVIPSSGVARAIPAEDQLLRRIDITGRGVPVFATDMESRVEGLPESKNGVWLIVSIQTYRAARGRSDLVIPHDSVRDEKGRIIGIKAFARPM